MAETDGPLSAIPGGSAPGSAWRITPNPDRIASVWWDEAKARFDAPPALRPMLDPFATEELYVNPDEGAAILAWAATLADWDEARPALLIEKRDA